MNEDIDYESLKPVYNMKIPEVLKTYLEYSSGNESPTTFHLWTAIGVFAGACERRVWIDSGFFKLALNFYVILVSPPGICSKNTAFGLGQKLLRAADFTIIRDAITKEKIIDELEESKKVFNIPNSGKIFQHSSITLIEEELNVLATTGAEMIKFLTSVYDTIDVYTYKTKNRGQYEIVNPCVNLLGAAVPTWFSSSIGEDVGSMGFIARCITVYENEPRGMHPIPRMLPFQKTLKEKLIKKLGEIGSMFGAITFSESAAKVFEKWYIENPLDVSEDYRILGYLVRKRRIHVWKLSALFAVMEGSMIIDERNVEGAIQVLDYTEKKMRLAFSSMGANKTAYIINKIVTYLATHDGVGSLKEIIRKFYAEPSMDRMDFKNALETIEEMKIAKYIIEGNEKYLELIIKDEDLIEKFKS